MLRPDDVYPQIIEWLRLLDDAARMNWKKKSPSGLYSPAGIVLEFGCAMRRSKEKVACGMMKECYANAQTIAIADDDYRYAEGWAMLEGVPIPIAHAWLLNANGLVVDPTWAGLKNGKSAVYYGVEIDTTYMCKRVLTTKAHHPMIDDYEFGYKLLNTPGLANEVIKRCTP
jgi:hypothetical protein